MMKTYRNGCLLCVDFPQKHTKSRTNQKSTATIHQGVACTEGLGNMQAFTSSCLFSPFDEPISLLSFNPLINL